MAIEAEDRVAITMTAEAARMFWKSLVWASTQAEEQGRLDHYDWLSWGAARVSYAQIVDEEGPNA